MPGPGYYCFGKEEENELLDVIRSGYLFRYGDEANSKFKHKVKNLEEEICKKFETKYALAVSSGTAALITAMSACGIGPGDEVVVPGYTFIASISSIIFCNAVPVLAEVDKSLTLDPNDVEQKITGRTKAIQAVHMLGNPCNIKALNEIVEKHNLIFVEDAAQAFGGSYFGKRLGTIGSLGCYSFNIFKTINAGDGGLVVTDEEELYIKAFAFHDQGHFPRRMDAEAGNRSIIGQNFRMNELSGAVLLAQFRKLDNLLQRLRYLKSRFKRQIQDIKELEFRTLYDPAGECSTILTVFLPDRQSAAEVAKRLNTFPLAASGWHVYNNMEQILGMKTINPRSSPLKNSFYKGHISYRKGMLPQTDLLLERAINISIGVVDSGLGAGFGINLNSDDEEVDRTAEKFKKVVCEVIHA